MIDDWQESAAQPLPRAKGSDDARGALFVQMLRREIGPVCSVGYKRKALFPIDYSIHSIYDSTPLLHNQP
jgi:hypothetical protein